MQNPQAVAISAVAGMGGVGKTELATRYAKTHQADYPGGICWLTAREANLAAAIIQFTQLHLNLEIPQQNWQGNPLNLTEQVEWCWQHWQPPEGLVLVVLDDVTDLEYCRDFLPKTNRFRLLMTTRLRNLDANIQEIPLDVLSPAEALQLFTAIAGEKRVQKELETAKQLCDWLGYLPLGLELVGRYLAKKPPHWTLAKMLQRLKAQRLEDEAVNPELHKTLSTAQRGLKAAFELSWQELEPMTQSIAELLSLFAPHIFAWQWVESATNLLNWNTADVETANDKLYERHLIQFVEDTADGYKIHPLIREFLQTKLTASPQAEEWKQAFADVFVDIAKQIPKAPTQEFIKSVKNAIPHLAEVAQNMTAAISDENLISPFVGLGTFYEAQGLYKLAESWREQSVSVVKSRLGEEHSYVATSFNNLALLHKSQGRYKEAEPLFLKALELYQRQLGDENLYVATISNNLAELYNCQERYTEAEPLFFTALELCQRQLGDENLYVATIFNNLANLYISQRKYTEAKHLLLKALELRQRLLGQEHPNVAITFNNLGLLYYSQGKYTEAEDHYRKALKLWQRVLGEEHPNVATSFHNLASLYYSQNRYTEAENFFFKALEIDIQLIGEEHSQIATTFNNLAEFYRSQGKYTEAEKLSNQALTIYQKTLGSQHQNTQNALLTVKSLHIQTLLHCNQQTLFRILQALAQQAELTAFNTEVTLTLLQRLESNPELLSSIRQALQQQTEASDGDT
ncbi:Tfp pilus assembly protein PilF [Cylindrospermum stagnale PCC 7417]|uniref:Tfp pilus assembly protein PilF n=1 Tax=Cylindrospermum stagnale PCC 7417 TaxID=56107 RepID=K9WYE9_9NOST|nr:Tfp pilus assembly protein PilF [Cylindrospermum stagnale PCC 7417]